LKSGDSLTLTLHVSSCGDGAWGASVWNGSSLNGQSFNLVAVDSTLATSIPCGKLASGAGFTVPDSLNPNCVTGQRGYYDKDGSIPANGLPYFVTNFPTTDQLHFRWPDQAGGDPLATFQYTICGSGALPNQTFVAWLNGDGTPASTSGTPAYILADDCNANANFLPAPYGTLMAIKEEPYEYLVVNTLAPAPQSPPGTAPGSVPYPGSAPTSPQNPGATFDVVVDTERITVQQVCIDNDGDPSDQSDCTETSEGEGEGLRVILRGVGGTTATSHSAGALVMSTPLPLLPSEGVVAPYTAGNQALMCISHQSSEGENGPHSTMFIDIGGDGWANHP
jgi:hypothetical protein